jgi:BASS family bile acid:Na+ symporter
MLAYLLFSAGLGVQTAQLRRLLRDPRPLFAGLAASFAVPVAFLVAVSQLVGGWLGADHAVTLLVGLSVLAAVSVGPTSTLWVQHANGNLALSLGLVLLSTLLSPVRTPAVFRASGFLVQEDCARVLHELVACGAGALLIVAVILPSLLGLAVKAALGETRVAPAVPLLKLVGPVNFLVLTYANASAALPQVVADPDLGFLAVTLGVTAGLCLTTFATGWGIARLLRADQGQRSALLFGMGMTNNSLAQALASAIAVSHPLVIALIVTHTLVQQLAAGVASRAFRRAARDEAVARAAATV